MKPEDARRDADGALIRRRRVVRHLTFLAQSATAGGGAGKAFRRMTEFLLLRKPSLHLV